LKRGKEIDRKYAHRELNIDSSLSVGETTAPLSNPKTTPNRSPPGPKHRPIAAVGALSHWKHARGEQVAKNDQFGKDLECCFVSGSGCSKAHTLHSPPAHAASESGRSGKRRGNQHHDNNTPSRAPTPARKTGPKITKKGGRF
jgi:hypothetical protein